MYLGRVPSSRRYLYFPNSAAFTEQSRGGEEAASFHRHADVAHLRLSGRALGSGPRDKVGAEH